jgi:hypothetical protein
MGDRVIAGSGIWFRGRLLPFIAGAESEGSGSGDGGAGAGDNGGGSDGGSGGSGDDSSKSDDASKASGDNADQGNRGDLNKALRESRRELADAKGKLAAIEAAKAEADRAAAEKAGEFEKLYADEKVARTKAETDAQAEITRLTAEIRFRDAERSLLAVLSDKHPAYVGKLRWMLPVLHEEMARGQDADEGALDAMVKKIASDYVKDHPAQADGRGAPGGAGGNGSNGKSDPLELFPGIKARLGG